MALNKKTKKLKTSHDNAAYVMILPAYLVFAVFILIPIVMVFYYSVTNYNMFDIPNLIGFNNYTKLFKDSDFILSMKNTLKYASLTLIPQLAVGLFLAIILYRKSKLVPVFRTAIYIPNVISMVCVSMVWLWIYEPTFGLLNSILKIFGIRAQQFLQDPKQAMICIIVMTIWKSCGYSMVVFLSGLTGIPASLYEASELDGAGVIRQFIYITWPMLKPTTFFLLVTGIVNSFAVFEQVNIMTGGGPLNTTTTVVHQIYRRGFLEYKMGYASAMAILLLFFSLIVTMLVFKFGNKGEDTSVS